MVTVAPSVLALPARAVAPVQKLPAQAVAEAGASQTRLDDLQKKVASCQRCRLHKSRTNPVFGTGSVKAQIMFVGEAPGYHEDQQGEPFVGQAGKLLDRLLEQIGLNRQDVFIANVLKCRPPNNRDPQPDEIEKCRVFLEEQIDLVQPHVICTLGNFATKLLSGKPDGISRVRGQPQPLPGRQAWLYPVYHPAAALYTPANLKTLEEDFNRLAQLQENWLEAKRGAFQPAAPQDKATANIQIETLKDTTNSNESYVGEQLGLF